MHYKKKEDNYFQDICIKLHIKLYDRLGSFLDSDCVSVLEEMLSFNVLRDGLPYHFLVCLLICCWNIPKGKVRASFRFGFVSFYTEMHILVKVLFTPRLWPSFSNTCACRTFRSFPFVYIVFRRVRLYCYSTIRFTYHWAQLSGSSIGQYFTI